MDLSLVGGLTYSSFVLGSETIQTCQLTDSYILEHRKRTTAEDLHQ